MKNIQKTNEICYCLGGKFKLLGGGGGGGGDFPPLNALKKTLGINYQGNCQMMQEMD